MTSWPRNLRHHRLLSTHCEGSSQVVHANALLSRRPVIISFEGVFNNVLLHFLVGFLLFQSVGALLRHDFPRALPLAGGATAGWALADAISYFLHMAIDSETWTRVITKGHVHGYALVDLHHDFTMNYSYMNGVELVAVTYPATVPLLLGFCYLHTRAFPTLLATSPFYRALFASCMGFGMMAGFAHKWAHERNHGVLKSGTFVALLQDAGVLLHPASHRKHHAATDDRSRLDFSLVSGVAGRLLDPLVAWWRGTRRGHSCS
jgi:hypothetical protein